MSGVIFKAATYCAVNCNEEFTIQSLLDHLNGRKALPIHGAMTKSVGFMPILETGNDDGFNRFGPFIAFDYVVMTRLPSDRVVLLHCDNKKRKQGLPNIGIKDEFYKLHYESMVAELLDTTLTKTKKTPVLINIDTGFALIGSAKIADMKDINSALPKSIRLASNMPADNTERLTKLIGHNPLTVSEEIETTSSVTMKSKTGARASWSNQDLMREEIIDAVKSGKTVCCIGLERSGYTFSLNLDGTITKVKRKQSSSENGDGENIPPIHDIEKIDKQDMPDQPEEERSSNLGASDVLAQAGDFIQIFQEIKLFLVPTE